MLTFQAEGSGTPKALRGSGKGVLLGSASLCFTSFLCQLGAGTGSISGESPWHCRGILGVSYPGGQLSCGLGCSPSHIPLATRLSSRLYCSLSHRLFCELSQSPIPQITPQGIPMAILSYSFSHFTSPSTPTHCSCAPVRTSVTHHSIPCSAEHSLNPVWL